MIRIKGVYRFVRIVSSLNIENDTYRIVSTKAVIKATKYCKNDGSHYLKSLISSSMYRYGIEYCFRRYDTYRFQNIQSKYRIVPCVSPAIFQYDTIRIAHHYSL